MGKINLCIDIGNSRTKAGQFKNGEMVAYDSDFSAKKLIEFRNNSDISILCCASGEDKAITNSLHKDELLSHLTNLPIVLDYRTPETLGRDRIASAVGAWNEFKDHTVLKIDLGTCLTIDLVHNNALIGGLISPGLSMRLKAMNVYTAGLPLVEINEKVTFPGKSTEESMQVGVYQSVINEIVGYVNWANLRYDKVVIVDCSSYPIDFAKEVKNEIFARPKLVLQGLNNIIEYNAK